MSKVYLGKKLADLDFGESALPVSKVILNLDEETYYESGDDTGLTIEADCPWASQDMADSVLAKMKGFVYKPFDGTDALLDPAAELGDAITVGGEYRLLASLGRSLDRQSAATVGAPGTDEIEDEYPYKSKQRRQTDRQLAKTRSMISKTAEEISLLVAQEVGELGDKYTELKVTLDGVTVTDESGTTLIKGSSIETGTLYVDAANINGTLTADQIVLSGSITWNDLSSGVQSTINGAYSSGVPSYITSTGINATTIRSPTIEANEFNIYPKSASDTDGSYNIYGMALGSQYHFLQIAYSESSIGGLPGITFLSPGGADAWWGFDETWFASRISYFSGTVDFSSATVTGLTNVIAMWG